MSRLKQKSKIVPFIPDDGFYFTKGIEAFQNRKFDLALKWMKKAMDSNPKEPLYPCQMSIIYTEIGAYHAANQLLTQVLKTADYVDCYYLLANNYAHLGLLNDAKKFVKLYLEKEPNGDFADDAKQLLEIIEIDEDEEELDFEEEDELLMYQETVFYHMEKEEWEKAIPVIEEMIVLFPEYTLARHDYAQALFFTGNKKEAIRMEQELLQEDPNDLYSFMNLALFHHSLGEEDSAMVYAEKLQKVFPIHEQLKLRIAVTFARIGQYDIAYERFCKLNKEMLKNHLSFYRWYSIAAYHCGCPSKAVKIWKEGCRRYPVLAEKMMPWND